MHRWLAAALAATCIAAHAQDYPTRPLRLIVADGPGSVSDARARAIAAKMQEGLGQSVVIEKCTPAFPRRRSTS